MAGASCRSWEASLPASQHSFTHKYTEEAWLRHARLSTEYSLSEGYPPGTGGLGSEGDLYHDHTSGDDLLTAARIDHTIVEVQAGASSVRRAVLRTSANALLDQRSAALSTAGRLRLPGSPSPGVLDRAGGILASLHGDLHRTVRCRPLHVREQFPRGKDGDWLGHAMECL